MAYFEEGHQGFTFNDKKWTVVKYDYHNDYRNKIANLQGTKAVDFVALYKGTEGNLFWIEVKDFRGYRIQNKPRLSQGEIALDVAQKIRDSIAGVVGAYCTSSQWETWQPFVQAVWCRKCMTRVLLWLEEDNIPRGLARRCNSAQVLMQHSFCCERRQIPFHNRNKVVSSEKIR